MCACDIDVIVCNDVSVTHKLYDPYSVESSFIDKGTFKHIGYVTDTIYIYILKSFINKRGFKI